mgnify:CR=1 FL=1
MVSVIYPDGFIEPIDRSSPWLDGLLAAWAPGGETEVFPNNTGRVIPKGSKLHFQLHYTTNGKAQSDQSTIGLYYTDKKPENEYLMVGAFNPRLQIPPGDAIFWDKAFKIALNVEKNIAGKRNYSHGCCSVMHCL